MTETKEEILDSMKIMLERDEKIEVLFNKIMNNGFEMPRGISLAAQELIGWML